MSSAVEDRLAPPEMPSGQVEIEAPPELFQGDGIGGSLMMMLPMLGGLGSVVFVAVANPGPMGLISGGMFIVAMGGFLVMTIVRNGGNRKARVTEARRSYLRHLASVRTRIRDAAAQQRAALAWRFPAPDALPFVASEPARTWRQDSQSKEFLLVRYGTGPQELAIDLVPPETDAMDALDPVAASALHRLIKTHRVQQDLPTTVLLSGFARIELTGPATHVRDLARALLCSAAVATSPEHLTIAVVASPENIAQWEWVKWLPHARSTVAVDAAGPARLAATDADELLPLLPADIPNRGRFMPTAAVEEAALPHLLLVVDGGHVAADNPLLPPDGVQGITVIELPDSWDELTDPSRLRLHVETSVHHDSVIVSAVRPHLEPISGTPDRMSLALAETVARRLAPRGQDAAAAESGSRRQPELTELLGLPDVRQLDVTESWRAKPDRDRLRVPIGTTPEGVPVPLDLKESAQQGMGPHGLVIGATGSGKSELLRTLVLGLAMTHSSEGLNFVLVDFKGGATFAGMANLPHVSAIITNLSEELSLVDRMQDALSGEMTRRQELLRRAGNYQSIRDYERARLAGVDLEPLPSLLIVADEFSELLGAKPEFTELFVAIGRLGRSLGIHLLLSSQRLEEGRLRGLDSHLSYRIGLRTFSAAESRTVLGVPDAYELPPEPGRGYLKADQSTLVEFRASYVSGPPPELGGVEDDSGTIGSGVTVLPFRASRVDASDALTVANPYVELARQAAADAAAAAISQEAAAAAAVQERSVFDIAVAAMAGRGPAAHQVWLPPLETPDTFDSLMPDLVRDPELGLISRHWRDQGPLVFPIGTVDIPREQRRETVVARLTGAGGHVGVVGAPRSGRSTLLRSIVTGLALTHTPREAQVYVLDFGGGTFAGLSSLPHVAGVGMRSEPDVVRRIVAEVAGIVENRERIFRTRGIDSIESYRRRRDEFDDGYGDVFVVIDGWSTLRSDFEDLEGVLQVLGQRALTYGVHFVTAATRWMDYRTAVRDILGTRYELRLGDPLDSEINRKAAANVPTNRAGHGLVPSGLHFLAALPRVDSRPDSDSVGEGIENLVAEVSAGWRGDPGPKLRLLPRRIALEDVRERVPDAGRRLVVGLDERALAPVLLDIDADPHFLVYGDGGSGRSTVVRTVLREIMRTRTPEEAQLFLVDYRRAHLGLVPEEYLAGYSSTAGQAETQMSELAEYLVGRLPGSDVTPAQLRERSWWSGADAIVVVDDYELVATSSGNPIAPLQPLLAQARDVGLHVVVSRRIAGSGRAYDQFLNSIKDLAQPGILLNGQPAEGVILGTVKADRQPPGRGRLVTRDPGFEVVQVAWTDPVE